MKRAQSLVSWCGSILALLAGASGPVLAQGEPPQVPPPLSQPTGPLPPMPVLVRPPIMPLPTAAEAVVSPASEIPLGRQEPSVSLDWVGPAMVRLGQPITYQIVVRNVSPASIHQVNVKHRVPAGIKIVATEPKSLTDGGVLSWDLGTMLTRQEKRIQLQLIPETKGDLDCNAQVTFTGSAATRLRVREPKLSLKATGPDKVMIGDMATLTFTASNPGDGPAEHVTIKAVLPEGLEHARGKVLDFDLGTLTPNESRTVQVVCATKSGGAQKCEASATADGNLLAADTASVDVILPRLDLLVSGPRLRYLDRHATYTLTVTNPGSAPASNVSLVDQLPAGFKFVNASAGGRYDLAARTVSWFIGDLTPGQSREVTLEVVASAAGDFKHKAIAMGSRGLKTEAEHATRIEGLSAVLMELVDQDDPVEVGSDTSYEVRVTNTGSKTETNLQLICTIPDRMEFRGARTTANGKFRLQGKDVVFEPLAKLAPKADVVFRVTVRGTAPGDLRFRARITADGLSDPVLKEESTKVYGDDVLPK